MISDKMKEVQLVAESKVLKIDPLRRLFSRFDKTVYIEEPILETIGVTGSTIAYVEAAQFFSLFATLKTIDITPTCCVLTLTNGAEYKLPFLVISWEEQSFKDEDIKAQFPIKLATGRLSSATLKNLANPMLQCIYVDAVSAVSCNSMVACLDGTVKSSSIATLLPPDILPFIEGSEMNLCVLENSYVLKIGESVVYVPTPQLDYTPTAEILRGALPADIVQYPIIGLLDSVKRLSSFGDFVTFTTDKITSGANYEPFSLPNANPLYNYNAQSLLAVLPQVRTISQSEYALFAFGDGFVFMISPEPVQTESAQD